MSHTVNVATQFKNFEAFQDALKSLVWTIKHNAQIRTYHSDPERTKIYETVGVNPVNGYDIGISLNKEGEISVHCDFYDGSIAKSLGQQLCKLKTQYVVEVTKQHYEDVEITEETEEYLILEAEDGE
jgi:hypothetical protein